MLGASRQVSGRKIPRSGGNGLVVPQDVLQRRDVRALGMGSLLGLFELLRIAEQHHALRRLRRGEDVRERHLARLVHEQHIDRARATPVAPRAMRFRRPRWLARR